MIAVRETSPDVFEPIVGNPTLLSIDGEVKAPLRTVMADSWTAEDRARFGVHLVEPADIPDGKQAVGAPTYVRRGGVVVEVRAVEDIPAPGASLYDYDLLKSELKALAARVSALEGKT
jgi:hypothetical protein